MIVYIIKWLERSLACSQDCPDFRVQRPGSNVMERTAAAATICRLVVFGLTVGAVLNNPDFLNLPRDLDCFEVWSGAQSVANAASARGFSAAAFDISRVPGATDVSHGKSTEDILTRDGFMRAVHLTMRLRRGGLLWLAPVCSSFVFLNVANTMRSASNYAGNVAYGPVREGNQMSETAVFLMTLAWARYVEPVLENPPGSMMFNYGPVKEVLLALSLVYYAICYRCVFSTEPYGKRMKKGYKLASTGTVSYTHLTLPTKRIV